MRYYDITSSTRADGSPYPFRATRVSEQSLRSLRGVFAKDGVTLHAKYRETISDKPVYRRATEAELAAGSESIVLNVEDKDVFDVE